MGGRGDGCGTSGLLMYCVEGEVMRITIHKTGPSLQGGESECVCV